MLTTSDAPIDYLTVPSGRTLDQSKTQRSTSFDERSRQNSENIASNLSLPTAINNSAKKSRSSTRWQSTSSRVNACQRLLENNDEEKMEDFQTILVSDIVPSNQIQNDLSDSYNPNNVFQTIHFLMDYILHRENHIGQFD
ncbi:hypothetical protein I4U23_007832 [Adineta vaga]|nr:hypothetical protein I4U23_007832 [Adineta vaga]